MRWFKHYSNAGDSECLAELERKFGFEGLGRYWKFIEFLNSRFDGTDCHFRVPREVLRALFRHRSWNSQRSFVLQLATIRGLKIECSGNVYEIDAPILLELQGRDFKKARSDRGSTAPKNKIKNKMKNVVQQPENNAVKEFESRFSEDFQKINEWRVSENIPIQSHLIGKILKHFETSKNFGSWVESVAAGKTYNALSESERKRYLASAIVKEIRSAAQ